MRLAVLGVGVYREEGLFRSTEQKAHRPHCFGFLNQPLTISWQTIAGTHEMIIDQNTYQKAFDAYLRKGTPYPIVDSWSARISGTVVTDRNKSWIRFDG